MSQDNLQNFPVPNPDNAPAGPTGNQRQLSAEESALASSNNSGEWFHLQVTYTDGGKTATGYITQYMGGAMYWDSYIIITDTPQTKFKSDSGAWLSDANQVTYKNAPFYLCVTAGPRYWVYLSNHYTDVKWWVAEGKLYNNYADGPAGCVPQDPPFYNRQLWVCFNAGNALSNCKMIPA